MRWNLILMMGSVFRAYLDGEQTDSLGISNTLGTQSSGVDLAKILTYFMECKIGTVCIMDRGLTLEEVTQATAELQSTYGTL